MPPILAIVYTDGAAAGRLISDIGYRLRDAGVAVAGLVQYSDGTPNCDMEVEELASRIILALSEDPDQQGTGCRLDPAALTEAAALVSASLRKRPQLVILNKFGTLEAEGGGLRDAIGDAIQLGIPVIAGVPHRHIESWRAFSDGLAQETVLNSPRLLQWLGQQGFDLTPHPIEAPTMQRIQRAG
jgi:hypothetical protein